MPSSFIASMTLSLSSSTVRSTPVRLERAWRRNWITETPGIASGCWKARNIPLVPRW